MFTLLSPQFWYILAAILIVIEVLIGGVGLIFAALAAIVLGGLINFEFITVQSSLMAIAYFFFFTTVFGVILWKPLKKFTFSSKGKSFSNIVGTTATVDEVPLKKGQVGNVKWSGAIMRATITSTSLSSEIASGSQVWVHNIEDGILQVDTLAPQNVAPQK